MNTVLNCNFIYAGIAPGVPRDRYYDASAWVGVPIMAITWLEPLTCDSFLVRWGGHVWFDVSIPLAYFLYYQWGIRQPPRDGITKKTA